MGVGVMVRQLNIYRMLQFGWTGALCAEEGQRQYVFLSPWCLIGIRCSLYDSVVIYVSSFLLFPLLFISVCVFDDNTIHFLLTLFVVIFYALHLDSYTPPRYGKKEVTGNMKYGQW